MRVNKHYAEGDLRAAINTIKASRWELFMAKLFGARLEQGDGGGKVIFVYYNDKKYLIDYVAH